MRVSTNHKGKVMSDIKKRFDESGYSVNKYARKIGVDHAYLSRFLMGKLPHKGKKSSPKYQRMIAFLRQDGILGAEK